MRHRYKQMTCKRKMELSSLICIRKMERSQKRSKIQKHKMMEQSKLVQQRTEIFVRKKLLWSMRQMIHRLEQSMVMPTV